MSDKGCFDLMDQVSSFFPQSANIAWFPGAIINVSLFRSQMCLDLDDKLCISLFEGQEKGGSWSGVCTK